MRPQDQYKVSKDQFLPQKIQLGVQSCFVETSFLAQQENTSSFRLHWKRIKFPVGLRKLLFSAELEPVQGHTKKSHSFIDKKISPTHRITLLLRLLYPLQNKKIGCPWIRQFIIPDRSRLNADERNVYWSSVTTQIFYWVTQQPRHTLFASWEKNKNDYVQWVKYAN